jgi:hypothetical protein
MSRAISGSLLAGFGLISKIAVEYLNNAQAANLSMLTVGLTWLFIVSGLLLVIAEYKDQLKWNKK